MAGAAVVGRRHQEGNPRLRVDSEREGRRQAGPNRPRRLCDLAELRGATARELRPEANARDIGSGQHAQDVGCGRVPDAREHGKQLEEHNAPVNVNGVE